MESATDGIFTLDGERTILSVKSMGYKMSGRTREGWKRYGFAALPLDGIAVANPGYYAQVQAEMHGSDIKQALVLVCAKDIIKAMQGDPIMQEAGSFSFYAEMVPYDPGFAASLCDVWEAQWDLVQQGDPGPALFYTKNAEWVVLEMADTAENKNSVNKTLTGTYSPCNYCDLRPACADAISRVGAA